MSLIIYAYVLAFLFALSGAVNVCFWMKLRSKQRVLEHTLRMLGEAQHLSEMNERQLDFNRAQADYFMGKKSHDWLQGKADQKICERYNAEILGPSFEYYYDIATDFRFWKRRFRDNA